MSKLTEQSFYMNPDPDPRKTCSTAGCRSREDVEEVPCKATVNGVELSLRPLMCGGCRRLLLGAHYNVSMSTKESK